MSRIAKGPSDSLFKNKRSRTIAKGDGLGLRLVLQRKAVELDVGALFGFARPENTVMLNSIDIDSSHCRAIVREIGERLRLSFEEDREIPASFKVQIERPRQLEDETQR
jgi:hypothetical protein